MDKLLTHDFGKSFPSTLTFSAYVFLVIGLFAMPYNFILGPLFTLMGIFFGFTRSGIQINLNNKTYRSYNSLFGLRQGKWQSLEAYVQMTLLKSSEKSAVMSASNRRTETASDIFYDIVLLNQNQLRQLKIKRLKDKDKAIEDIRILSAQLEMPIVRYKPNIRRPKIRS
jgi:hypothetical protein